MGSKMGVSVDHWRIVLDCAQEYPEIITNKFSTHIQGTQRLKEIWENICTRLNSLGQGFRTIEQWKKSITVWKSKTKLKASRLKIEQNKTDGGACSTLILTNLEERLLGIMGTLAAYGDNTIEEQGIKRKIEKVSINMLPIESVAKQMETEEEITAEDIVENDHDYYTIPSPVEEVLISTSSITQAANLCQTEKSDVLLISPPQSETSSFPTINTSTKRRKVKNAISSKTKSLPDIIDMHADILKVLKNIDTNMSNMAESLRGIFECMKKFST